MDKVNSFYKLAYLFDGKYDGVGKVSRTNYRYYSNLFIDYVRHLFFISHLIVFLSDNETMKNELVYLKITSGFGYRFANFFAGRGTYISHRSIGVYQDISKDAKSYRCFNFFFYFDSTKLQEKYNLTKQHADSIVRLQNNFFRIISFYDRFFLLLFGMLNLKSFYENAIQTLVPGLTPLKFISYALIVLLVKSCIVRITLNLAEITAGCLFLSSQLEEIADRILKLSTKIFKDDFPVHDRSSSNKASYSRMKSVLSKDQYMNNQIEQIIKNYNLIIINQNQMNQHSWKTLSFLNELIVFTVIFPSLILFDRNRNLFYIVFYSTNYIFIFFLFYIIVHFNSIYLNSVSLSIKYRSN